MIGNVDVPPSAIAHAAPAVVARLGAPGAEQLAGFSAGLAKENRLPRRGGRNRDGKAQAQGTPGATLAPGAIAVLKLPNAQADAALDGARPRLAAAGLPARVVVLGHGGRVLADRVLGAGQSGRGEEDASVEIVQGAERIVAVGQGDLRGAALGAGLLGWHAGMQLPYVGYSTAIGPGVVVHAVGEALPLHRERVEAGWIGGAELSRGVSTVTTTFAEAPATVVIILDDPAAFGNEVGDRRLLLGLDGADRLRDAAGIELPPRLLAMENRSVVAYDIVPERRRPVVVTIASELGWSLVGVMGSPALDAAGAIALIAARGLDAALRPFAVRTAGAGECQLTWGGATRTRAQQQQARALAAVQPLPPAQPAQPARRRKGKGR
jgi:hypothetical protein